MLGGAHINVLVTVTLLFLTKTGTQCRAENDFSSVTLPDWRKNSDYVTQCFYDRDGNLMCGWTRNQLTVSATGDAVVKLLESGPLELEGEACLEFWYLAPVAARGSELRTVLKRSIGLEEIWTSPASARDSWRQVFVPLNIIEPGTQILFEVVAAVSTEEQVTLNRIGVRRGPCGHQCERNTELWTDESTRCLCSAGQLLCSPCQCPEGQICAPQRGDSGGVSASGTCTVHSNTDCSTFDGVMFRFLATCTITLAKTCSSTKALPVFSVEVVNEQDGNSSLPIIQQVNVEIGDFRVSLMRRQTSRAVVNGVWKKLPLRLSGDTVSIRSNPAAVILESSFSLSVSFDKTGAVHINLPPSYSDLVCGLCGNFNQLGGDDFRKPDGTDAPDATSLAESWQSGQTASSCETILLPHVCDPLEEADYASELHCGGLLSSTGPFAVCLSVLGPQSYFRDCVVAMCSSHGQPTVLCETLQAYADVCQEAGVAIPIWRNSTYCPLQCGENSHYNSCANGCPDVCASEDIDGSCGSCVERCECDSGFKLSGGKCVPAGDCGCWRDGKHYEKGETWLQGECVWKCQCMGDNVVHYNSMQCPEHEICMVKDGVKGCFPPSVTTCSVYGDPHYVTYDGMAYSFQGGCSYTLATTCGEGSSVQFTIVGHNMHPPLQNFTRSKLEAVTLQVENLHLTMNQSSGIYVNNVGIHLPYSTKGPYGSVSVFMKSNHVILEATFGLRMTLVGQNRLFLQVDERYKYKLCGLCGTYSEHQDDDFVKPGGQNATGPFEFGDSWRVLGDNECIAHPNDPKRCGYDEENAAYRECNVLLRAVFKPCHAVIHPSIYISSCVYDYCATSGDKQTLCESLKSYAAACQVAGLELPYWQTDTACADLSTTSAPPTTTTSPTPDQNFCPMNCNFENNLCGWAQLIQDSFDWTRNSGPTPSNLTGPTKDHTTGAGFYMYIEANSATHGDSARLLSSMCHYSGPLCLHFWYHMHGSATAMALNIYLLKDNKATKVWAMKNNQGPQWHLGYVDIRVSGPFQIILEGIRGSTAQSDVAIDDFSIHFGSCSGRFPGVASGTELPSTTTEVTPSHLVCDFDCSFDSNLCRWNQMLTDAFDWTWQSGATPTLMTGPSADHTGDGHYLYIEASSATHGDTARLISSECSVLGPQCLQFWYHMHGSADTMGLNVYLLQNKRADAIWWKRNNKGNVWHMAQVDFTTTGYFQIIIEGRRGSNEESDVSIDDVKHYSGRCSDVGDAVTKPLKPNTTVPPTVLVPVTTERPLVNVTVLLPNTAQPPVANGTFTPVVEATTDFINETNDSETSVCQLDCNFEQNLCQWSQLLTDVFDWTRLRGSTPTMMTGPSSDHTSGDGYYLHIEGNSATHGDTARLISSECSDLGPQCLQFWYHMYGSADTMGLNVYLLQNKRADAIWWKRNNQGNMWHMAQVDLTTTGAFQIIFEGRRGSNDQSDVAIDDVSLHHGHCKEPAKPTIPASTTLNPITTEGPELPPANSSTASQPQTPAPSETQPTFETTTTTTTAATGCDTHVPIAPTTSLTTETPVTDDLRSSPHTPITSIPIRTTTTGPHTTARTQPPTTEHTEVETSQQPETNTTEKPQTARPEQPATSTNEPRPPTTARPQPPSTVEPPSTARPQPSNTAEPPSTAGPQHPSTVEPQPPSTAGQQPTTTRGTQPTTARPQPTTAGPQPPTTAEPQTPSTAGTQPTTVGTQPTTPVTQQPPSTPGPQPPTTAEPHKPSTARPHTTTAGPQPTTARPQSATARPNPTTTPVTQQIQSTAEPQPPTTAEPQPPSTAELQPTTTRRPQPTTARPQPTTAGPQSTAAVTSQPPSTERAQPTTTTISNSTTTSRPPVPTPSCPQNSHYTTCIPACSLTCTHLNGPPNCRDKESCVEGCVCDEGFVQKWWVCVPIQQCGCVERNGVIRQFNEVWYTDHCSQKCECEKRLGGGKIDCDDNDECDGNAVCLEDEEGDFYCQSTGFNECTIKGDEYRTLDKMKYDFEGEHSYVLVQTKNLPNNLPGIYIEWFKTRTVDDDDDSQHGDSSSEEDHSHGVRDDDEEEDYDSHDDYSHDDNDNGDDSHDDDSEEHEENYRLKELKIRVYNHTIELKEKQKLVVDGRRTRTPVSPSPGLNIYEHFSRIYLKTDFGLSVEFNGHSTAEIILPRIYRRKVGGLCGNFDGRRQNDWMKPDGSRARTAEEFGESWRV